LVEVANKSDKANPVGRPLIFKSVEEIEELIEEYFDFCDNRTQKVYSAKADGIIECFNPAPYTMSGLARRLKIDRRTLLNYTNKEEFFPTIRDARERIHEDVEQRLMEKNATGPIFNLKNNFGWVDQVDSHITGTPLVVINKDDERI